MDRSAVCVCKCYTELKNAVLLSNGWMSEPAADQHDCILEAKTGGGAKAQQGRDVGEVVGHHAGAPGGGE